MSSLFSPLFITCTAFLFVVIFFNGLTAKGNYIHPIESLHADTLSSLTACIEYGTCVCIGTDDFYYCPTDQRPIPRDYVCDGYSDCTDESDESDCGIYCTYKEVMYIYIYAIIGSGPMRCQSHEMSCSSDNKCINKAFQCDGYSHCRDGSDETGCDCKCSIYCNVM